MNKTKIECKCGFKDKYEPDEFGLSYYQAVGECPHCGKDLGTKKTMIFRINNEKGWCEYECKK